MKKSRLTLKTGAVLVFMTGRHTNREIEIIKKVDEHSVWQLVAALLCELIRAPALTAQS